MMENLFGEKLDVITIERIRQFEPEEGYYLAFSGGKDSVCLLDLAKRAGVKFDAHYSVMTCDPPELLRFIHRNFPEVIWERPKESMFKAIVKRGFPTRSGRWCCEEYKERCGSGRIVLLGIRAEESYRRSKRGMVSYCFELGKTMISPMIDWKVRDVWNYIGERRLKYCSLYDEGWDRIGCVICPFMNRAKTLRAMERWPRIFNHLRRAFEQLYEKRESCRKRWPNAQMMYDWWLSRDLPYPAYQGEEEEGVLSLYN